jgi:beta-arrestin
MSMVFLSKDISLTVKLDSEIANGLQMFVVQHVDVCMFSNGKFKNVVALINSKEECPLGPGASLNRTYTLSPAKGATKNWIALEDSYNKLNATLASTVTCNSPDERNVFAIYVSYYVKVKLVIGAMGGELSVKLPFSLSHSRASTEKEETSPEVTPVKTPSGETKAQVEPVPEEQPEVPPQPT